MEKKTLVMGVIGADVHAVLETKSSITRLPPLVLIVLTWA